MEITCAYTKCNKAPSKKAFLCKVCRERIYCSEECLQKDWNEVHSEICLAFSRGASVFKFKFEDFEGLHKGKSIELNSLPYYGVLGTSSLVKHTQSLKPFILKTVFLLKFNY